MKKLFAITCKYTPQKSFVYGSVDNILKHYPRSDIVIVDSCSEDKTYLADLRSKYPTVMTEDVCNQNYEYGGTVHAFNKFKNQYDVFFFLQDTLHIVNFHRQAKCQDMYRQKVCLCVFGILLLLRIMHLIK